MAKRSTPVATGTDVSEKWGERVAERGFAQIPNYLLYLNQFLDADHKLSAIELLVLLQVVATWWRTDDLPFPSMATLATRSGVSERQVQRAIAKLEKSGFLRRVKRRNSGIVASNAYDLSPLRALLDGVARAFPNAYPRQAARGRTLSQEKPLAIQQADAAPPKPGLDAGAKEAGQSASEWEALINAYWAHPEAPQVISGTDLPPQKPTPALPRRLLLRSPGKPSGGR